MFYLYFQFDGENKGKNNTLNRTLMHIMIIFGLLIIVKLINLEELYFKTIGFILNIVLST